ncbi:uncharacterized protein LOC123660432 [Melitaea cinxia]|uniref:uncharacterized protein LOC123660432 n=1 Tax=Melitaea cinxia TaxID=113334 RepID=UPI001E26ED70|nr:uncharacterized protein LOC123660432 [Melitaea cinxia]
MADFLKKIDKVPPNQARKRGVKRENWKRERKRREMGRQNVSVQGEENYRSEIGQPKYVTKRRKKISDLAPVILPRGNKVNIKKILDVANLLKKHFGEDWWIVDPLKYYKDIEENNNNFAEHEYIQCVALEESENFIL